MYYTATSLDSTTVGNVVELDVHLYLPSVIASRI